MTAPVKPIALNGDGNLDPGDDFDNVRWWKQRGVPGNGSKDTTYLICHTVAKGGGVCDRLPLIKQADTVSLTVGGKPLTVVVDRTKLYLKNRIKDADEVWDPMVPNRVIFITCFTEGGQRTDKNFVAFAHVAR